MPQRLTWTPRQEAALVQLRGGGASWDAIAATLHISRNATIERGRRLGARLPLRAAAARVATDDPDRPPLPPGHADSWGVLVAGTVLEATKYPVPPPLGRSRAGVLGE